MKVSFEFPVLIYQILVVSFEQDTFHLLWRVVIGLYTVAKIGGRISLFSDRKYPKAAVKADLIKFEI